MGLPLITAQEYKAYAGISSPNHDTEINSLIPKVSQLVKTYCKSTLVDYVNDPKVEHLNGGYGSLILSESPVIAVSSVELSIDYGITYVPLTEFVDYVVDQCYVVATNPSGFSHKLRGYRVTYTAGFEEVPADLKLAVFDLLTYYRKNDGAIHSPKAPGTNSVQIEYISTTSLPAHIRRVLDLYRGDHA